MSDTLGDNMEKLTKSANGQWTLEKSEKTETLEKGANDAVRNSVKAANFKLKALGVKGGEGYGITSAGTPHWAYDYDSKHKDKVDEIHEKHIAPHQTDSDTHEDYEEDTGSRHTYGGNPEHMNATADKHPQGMVSYSSKKLKSK